MNHEFPAEGMKFINFSEAEVNVKHKIIDILNQSESICKCFMTKLKNALHLELLVDKCNLKDFDFYLDVNNKTFADKEL